MLNVLKINSSFDINPDVWLYFLKKNQVIFKEVFCCSNPISSDHLDFRIVKNQLFSQLLNLDNDHLLLNFLVSKVNFGIQYSPDNLTKIKEYIFDLFKFNAKHSEIRNVDKQKKTEDLEDIKNNKIRFAIIEKLVEFNQDDIVKNIRYFCYHFESRENRHTLKKTTNPIAITANVSQIIEFYSQGDSQYKKMSNLKLTPSALNHDLKTNLISKLKTRRLSDYEPRKPCPSPEKIESQSSTKQPYHSKFKMKTRDSNQT
jgi:hypothetical protein